MAHAKAVLAYHEMGGKGEIVQVLLIHHLMLLTANR